MSNLVTGPHPFERVEALLPEHRERLFAPRKTLSGEVVRSPIARMFTAC